MNSDSTLCPGHLLGGIKANSQTLRGEKTETDTERERDRQTERQTERQTDRKTDRQTDRQTDNLGSAVLG